ncbi:MAG: hypothetical protein KGQ38_05475 [Actinomycetales bacterium]|nr:hypothetical protein [Actinomycetales bacterium]
MDRCCCGNAMHQNGRFGAKRHHEHSSHEFAHEHASDDESHWRAKIALLLVGIAAANKLLANRRD